MHALTSQMHASRRNALGDVCCNAISEQRIGLCGQQTSQCIM